MKDLSSYVSLAHRQHGVVSREQLLQLGASRSSIQRGLVSHRLESVFAGVYRISGAPPTDWSALVAAALWAGPRACVSHFAAAWVHQLDGLGRKMPREIDVLFECGVHPVAPDQVKLRWSRNFVPTRDTVVVNGVRCTNLARTLIDLAAVLDVGTLEQIIDGALRSRPSLSSWTLSLLRKYGYRGVTGAAALRRLLHERTGHTQDSALEVKLLRLIRNARLPSPETNVAITDDEARHIATVDFAWLKHRVAMQAHRYAFHSSRAAFEKDHRQSSRLTAYGWRVLEITSRRLENEPHLILAELRRTLTPPKTHH